MIVVKFLKETTVCTFMGIASALVCLVGHRAPHERLPLLSVFSFMRLGLCAELLSGLELVFLGTINSTFKHLKARQYVKCLACGVILRVI